MQGSAARALGRQAKAMGRKADRTHSTGWEAGRTHESRADKEGRAGSKAGMDAGLEAHSRPVGADVADGQAGHAGQAGCQAEWQAELAA